jgi:hypothetical protein
VGASAAAGLSCNLAAAGGGLRDNKRRLIAIRTICLLGNEGEFVEMGKWKQFIEYEAAKVNCRVFGS